MIKETLILLSVAAIFAYGAPANDGENGHSDLQAAESRYYPNNGYYGNNGYYKNSGYNNGYGYSNGYQNYGNTGWGGNYNRHGKGHGGYGRHW
nr:glycine-rich protein DC9.1-like [Leptinotarsa decemlineata]